MSDDIKLTEKEIEALEEQIESIYHEESASIELKTSEGIKWIGGKVGLSSSVPPGIGYTKTETYVRNQAIYLLDRKMVKRKNQVLKKG